MYPVMLVSTGQFLVEPCAQAIMTRLVGKDFQGRLQVTTGKYAYLELPVSLILFLLKRTGLPGKPGEGEEGVRERGGGGDEILKITYATREMSVNL